MADISKTDHPTPTARSRPVTTQVRLALARDEVHNIRVVDTDFVVQLKNGKKLVIPDGALKSMLDPSFALVFKDGEVAGAEVIQNAGLFEIHPVSTTTVVEKEGTRIDTDPAPAPSPSLTSTPATTSPPALTPASTLASTLPASTAPSMADSAARSSSVTSGATSAVTLPDARMAAISPGLTSTTTSAMLAPKTGMFSFLADLPPSLGALGALGLLGGTSGGGSSASSTSSSIIPYTVSGTVSLGPVIKALAVKAYDNSGNSLYSGSTDDSGTYRFRITNGYKGVILVVISDPTPDTADYRDETGELLSLNSVVVRALSTVDGQQDTTINVTPLTEMAVQTAQVPAGSTAIKTVLATTVNDVNTRVGQQFGLGDVTKGEVVTTITKDGKDQNGNAYGEVLAKISSADADNQTPSTSDQSAMSSILKLPVVAGTPSSTSFTEVQGPDDGSQAVVINDKVTVAHLAGTSQIKSAEVKISIVQTGDQLLFTDTDKIKGTYSAGTLTLTTADGASPTNDDFQTALRSVKFNNTSDTPDTTTRSITFKVTDKTNATSTLFLTNSVMVTGTNDTPIVTPPTAITLTDTSAADRFANQTGTLLANDAEGDSLTYGIQGIASGDATTLGGVAYDVKQVGTYGTLYVVSTGTDKGKYVYVANNDTVNAVPGGTTPTEIFTVTAGDGNSTGTSTLDITITGTNDTPQMGGSSLDDTFSAVIGDDTGDNAVVINDTVTVSDRDSPQQIRNATVTITCG